jgi:F0F1-type ATP synthase assembly protein I
VQKTAPTNWTRLIAAYGDLGLRFAVAAALGGYLGYLLDQKLSISPIGLILGVMLGGTAGFISLYRTVMRAESKNDSSQGRQAPPQKN